VISQRPILYGVRWLRTYSTCTDAKHLQTMLAKLEELMKVFKSGLPSSEGLTLQPLSLLKRTLQIKQKYRNLSKRASTYSSLESPSLSKSGRKKANFGYRNRVGRKAQCYLWSVYLTTITVPCIHSTCIAYFTGSRIAKTLPKQTCYQVLSNAHA